MPRVSQPTIVAFLSAAMGVVVTLLLAAMFINKDPQLVAAEQRFSELPAATARQTKNRFNSLQNSPEKHRKFMEIHEAVTVDPKLNARLEHLYSWWLTCNDALRAELRETSTDRWPAEIQKQMSKSSAPGSVVLSLRQLPGPGTRGRPTEIHVSADQIDLFLKAALPEKLSDDESQLIESSDPQDRPLARGVVIVKRVLQSRPGLRAPKTNKIDKIFDAATSQLRPALSRKGVAGDRVRTGFTPLSILKSVMDHLSAKFFDRQTISKNEVEEQFAALETSERIAHMLSDPAEATMSLQAQLKSADKNTASSRLASELAILQTRFQKRFKEESRWEPRDRRPDGERLEKKRRGPGESERPPRGKGPGGFRRPPGDRRFDSRLEQTP